MYVWLSDQLSLRGSRRRSNLFKSAVIAPTLRFTTLREKVHSTLTQHCIMQYGTAITERLKTFFFFFEIFLCLLGFPETL